MTGVSDRAVSMGCVVAYAGWAVSTVVLLIGVLLWEGRLSDQLVRVSLWLAAVAATATVRSYFVSANRNVRNAFALQHEAAAADGRLEVVR